MGPLHIAALEIKRVGWSPDPHQLFGLIDAQGARFHMGNTSPAQIGRLFSLARQHDRLLALSEALARKAHPPRLGGKRQWWSISTPALPL